MIKIIAPSQFNTIPWKNGQGETTELAINEHGCLDDFDWRLSIASVSNDGIFSNFTGYQRNLILIEGAGISLHHDAKSTDILDNLLDIARFDGGCETYGTLTLGAIKDFNIITRTGKVSPKVDCYRPLQQATIELNKQSICFAYSLTDEMTVEISKDDKHIIPVGHLAKIIAEQSTTHNNSPAFEVKITGQNMIIVQLDI